TRGFKQIITDTMRNILLLHADQTFGEILKLSVERNGFRATVIGSRDMLVQTAGRSFDLVICDSSNLDDLQIASYVRRITSSPLLVLASAGTERQWAGVADEVLSSPFAIQDLLEQISVLLERQPLQQTVYSCGDVYLNLENHRVTRGTRPVHLGPTEFRLLHLLLREPQRLWSREEILKQIWPPDRDERVVDVTIKKLRAALNGKGDGDAIRTVRGAGYGLA
ncbi:MAG: winged helix-turn-helix domain-containing protein, partial [Pseudorhizobium sp.]